MPDGPIDILLLCEADCLQWWAWPATQECTYTGDMAYTGGRPGDMGHRWPRMGELAADMRIFDGTTLA